MNIIKKVIKDFKDLMFIEKLIFVVIVSFFITHGGDIEKTYFDKTNMRHVIQIFLECELPEQRFITIKQENFGGFPFFSITLNIDDPDKKYESNFVKYLENNKYNIGSKKEQYREKYFNGYKKFYVERIKGKYVIEIGINNEMEQEEI